MSLETLLAYVRFTRSVLVNEREIWFNAYVAQDVTQEMRRALRRHRRGVRLLLAWASIDTCANPELHRQYWRYAGHSRYICEACERLLPWIA